MQLNLKKGCRQSQTTHKSEASGGIREQCGSTCEGHEGVKQSVGGTTSSLLSQCILSVFVFVAQNTDNTRKKFKA